MIILSRMLYGCAGCQSKSAALAQAFSCCSAARKGGLHKRPTYQDDFVPPDISRNSRDAIQPSSPTPITSTVHKK